MEQQILDIVYRLVKIAEEYGVYSYIKTHDHKRQILRREFDKIMDELVQKLRAIRHPPQFGTPSQLMHQQQMAKLQQNYFNLVNSLFEAHEKLPKEPRKISIEFSL